MKKNMIKIMSILMLVIMAIMTMSNVILATSASSVNPKNMLSTAKDTSSASASANKIVGAIITVTKIIAVGVAIVMLLVLAIKYMSAAPSDKAEIKKSAVIYVTGAVILFAAGGILSIIESFADNINK